MKWVAPLDLWFILVFLLTAASMTHLKTAQDTWRADAAAAVKELIQASSRGDISLVVITDKSSLGEVETLLEASRGAALFQATPNSSRLAQVVAGARQVRWTSWMVVVVVVSDDLTFLDAFARQSREGRLLVWATRLIVVTRRGPPRLHLLHQTLSLANSLLLLPERTADVKSSDHSLAGRLLPKVAAWTVLPYRGPGVAPLRVASWMAGRGLNLHQLIFFNKFSKLYGEMNLLVAMEQNQRNFVVMLPDPTVPGGQRLHFKGYMIPVLDYLAQGLNFTYTFQRPADGSWGGKMRDGSFSGMTGQVHREEVHFGLGPFAIDAGRYEAVDFTWPLNYVVAKVLAGLGSPEVDSWGFLHPLTSGVWVALVTSFLLLSLIIILTASFSQEVSGSESLATEHLYYVSVMLRQSLVVGSAWWWWERVMLGVWMLMTFVLTQSYQSNLMSLLAVRHLSQPYQTLKDVVDDPGVGMIWHKDTALILSVMEATSGILHEVKATKEQGRLTLLQLFEYGNIVDEVIKQRKVIIDYDFVVTATRSSYFSRTGRCDLYLGRENIAADHLSLISQKDNPLIIAFNVWITSMNEAGLFDYWAEQGTPNISACKRVPTKITVSSSFSLRQCWAMLVVLAGGLAVGLATFSMEVVLAGALRP